MAIAQRQFPGVGPYVARHARPNARPAARPDRYPTPARRPTRAAIRVPVGLLVRPILLAATLSAAFVTYLSGFAQMTAAGYERARLKVEQSMLLQRQQMLDRLIVVHANPGGVASWAEHHGMVHVSGAAVPLRDVRAGISPDQSSDGPRDR